MKKYLIAFSILPFICNAGYMSKPDLSDCNKSSRPFYQEKSKCVGDCVKIPKNYKCETFSEQPTQIDDKTKPKYSKNQINKCGEYCETLFPDLVCLDLEERPIFNSDLEEIYCSKHIGYEKKSVLMFREDASKKSSYEAAINAIKSAKKAKRDEVRINLKDKLKSDLDLTSDELRKVLIHLLGG